MGSIEIALFQFFEAKGMATKRLKGYLPLKANKEDKGSLDSKLIVLNSVNSLNPQFPDLYLIEGPIEW
ncbi:hypothetical protein GCM10011516_06930 [Sphingobacterium cellulitidis]|uniref:Uncharacterized protein n=1 Tax=Sphingobacterium cellulitidis TaxID=1768011 RepID=A0A8H9KUI2_9SPHI|nr:hypothetical protein GCM10011516_06930 [Sphingobacterium soli]